MILLFASGNTAASIAWDASNEIPAADLFGRDVEATEKATSLKGAPPP